MNSMICPVLSFLPACVELFSPAAGATVSYLVISVTLIARGGTRLGMGRMFFWIMAIVPSFFYTLNTQTPTAPTPLSSAFVALSFCLGATVARARRWPIPHLYSLHWPEVLFVSTAAFTVGTTFASFWFAHGSGGLLWGFSGWFDSQIWFPPAISLAYYFSCRANPTPPIEEGERA